MKQKVPFEAFLSRRRVVAVLDPLAQIVVTWTARDGRDAASCVVAVDGEPACGARLLLERPARRAIDARRREVGRAERIVRRVAARHSLRDRGQHAAEGVVRRLRGDAIGVDDAPRVAEDIEILVARRVA